MPEMLRFRKTLSESFEQMRILREFGLQKNGEEGGI